MYLSVDVRAFQATVVISFILYIKLLITLLIQSSKRTASGTRPPEDNRLPGGKDTHGAWYAPSGTVDQQKVIADVRWQIAIQEDVRWQRIVANDLENIILGVIVAVVMVFVASSELAHIVLYSVFALSRVMWTISYGMAIQPTRTIFWWLSVLSIIGLGINGIVGVFYW